MGQTKKERVLEILRFLLVGALATVCDYATFWLFDALLFPLLPFVGGAWEVVFLCVSTALGFLVGLLINWALSVSFVFASAKKNPNARSKKSFWKFTLIALIGLALTEVGVLALVAVLPDFAVFGKTVLFGTEWKKWLAKAVTTCIVLTWNYLARKRFVFRSE
jgi:putative flippase GtrA